MTIGKKSQTFSFIAKNPPAMLIAGGILIILLGNQNLGMFLIILGIILQIGWLARIRPF
jgi:hypothetical protein